MIPLWMGVDPSSQAARQLCYTILGLWPLASIGGSPAEPDARALVRILVERACTGEHESVIRMATVALCALLPVVRGIGLDPRDVLIEEGDEVIAHDDPDGRASFALLMDVVGPFLRALVRRASARAPGTRRAARA